MTVAFTKANFKMVKRTDRVSIKNKMRVMRENGRTIVDKDWEQK